MDLTFAALSDPTRRAMLQHLTRGPATVGALARPFSMSLQAASKHLRVLERARLVRKDKVGRSRVVLLEAGPLREAEAWLNAYRRFWEGRLDALAEVLTEIEGNQLEGDDGSNRNE